MSIFIYPKNATLYQGLPDIRATDQWYTDDIEYACDYTGDKNGLIKVVKTVKTLALVDTSTLRAKDFSSIKDIKLENGKKQTLISMQTIFKITTGIDCKKERVVTEKDINDLVQGHPRYKNTQYGRLYKLKVSLGKEKQFINRLRIVIKTEFRPVIIKKTDINRMSTLDFDLLFLNNLKRVFPKSDGYIGFKLQSDFTHTWQPVKNKNKKISCSFSGDQLPEIALYKPDKIKLHKNLKSPQHICSYLKKIVSDEQMNQISIKAKILRHQSPSTN